MQERNQWFRHRCMLQTCGSLRKLSHREGMRALPTSAPHPAVLGARRAHTRMCRSFQSLEKTTETVNNWILCVLSHVRLFATPQTVAHQAPLPMEFSQEDLSGLPFPSPGDLSNPGVKSRSPALQADSLPAELPGKPSSYTVNLFSLMQSFYQL